MTAVEASPSSPDQPLFLEHELHQALRRTGLYAEYLSNVATAGQPHDSLLRRAAQLEEVAAITRDLLVGERLPYPSPGDEKVRVAVAALGLTRCGRAFDHSATTYGRHVALVERWSAKLNQALRQLPRPVKMERARFRHHQEVKTDVRKAAKAFVAEESSDEFVSAYLSATGVAYLGDQDLPPKDAAADLVLTLMESRPDLSAGVRCLNRSVPVVDHRVKHAGFRAILSQALAEAVACGSGPGPLAAAAQSHADQCLVDLVDATRHMAFRGAAATPDSPSADMSR